MALLWINIFSATLSRFPFKKHHIGFVITHIGLLTLLIGGMLTASIGVDGELRLQEGTADKTVYLQRLVLRTQLQKVNENSLFPISRAAKAKNESSFSTLNERLPAGLKIKRWIPYSVKEQVYVKSENSENTGNQEVAIHFTMKSPFFNVSDSLHTQDKPEVQMGPATLRIVKDSGATVTGSKKKKSDLIFSITIALLILSQGALSMFFNHWPIFISLSFIFFVMFNYLEANLPSKISKKDSFIKLTSLNIITS